MSQDAACEYYFGFWAITKNINVYIDQSLFLFLLIFIQNNKKKMLDGPGFEPQISAVWSNQCARTSVRNAEIILWLTSENYFTYLVG